MNASTTQRPLVTVGMPAYNSEEHIKQAIDSILDQTLSDFELLISDNASTEATQEICETYARNDDRVRYERQRENLGANGNYAFVLQQARGSFFKWASSNDYCAPTFLELCVAVLENYPDVILAYPRTRLFSRNLDDFYDYQEDLVANQASPVERMLAVVDRLRLNNIMNGVFRTETLRKIPAMATFHDADRCMMAELALYGKFIEVPEYLFYRRMDEDSSISMGDEERIRAHYHPGSKKPLRLQSWKRRAYHFGAVRRWGLGKPDSFVLIAKLIRRTIWERQALWREVLFGKSEAPRPGRSWDQL